MGKVIKIRNLEIGQGRPKICALIIGDTEEEILDLARKSNDVACDMAEFRADHYEHVQDPEKLKKFTVRMGWVTFVVGIVQGITAYAVLQAGNLLHYLTAVGFTLFSIASVACKLKGKSVFFRL